MRKEEIKLARQFMVIFEAQIFITQVKGSHGGTFKQNAEMMSFPSWLYYFLLLRLCFKTGRVIVCIS